jgi:serine protease Do
MTDVRIALALAGAAILFGSAATLAVQEPSLAQTANTEPQNAQTAMRRAAPSNPPGSFADLTARLQPAVVNVSTTQEVEVGRMQGLPHFAPGTPLDEIFKRFQEQMDEGEGQTETREATSLGSGFLISPDGYIVTNNHVVTGRTGSEPVDTITVTLSDQREFKAKIVGRDELSDLALLKIDGKDLPYVRFGNSEGVRVGDWVIAIGNPFGLGGTVTAGIVSALHRGLNTQYGRYIQTDASINMGNSGGPMFDLNGNVIGINTAIFSPTGGNVGIGFAIPAEQASPIIEQLRTIGRVRRGYLGVSIQPVTPDIAEGLGLKKDNGEIVASVESTGPAAKAGLKPGDVIVAVNHQEVTTENTLSMIVASSGIGNKVPITFIRGGKRQTTEATLTERPPESVLADRNNPDDADETAPPASEESQAARKSLGITLAELTPELRTQLGVDAAVQGVVIADLNRNSDAAKKGLQRGDIILSINQQPTKTAAAAAAIVDKARKAGRDTVVLFVQRGSRPPTFIGIKMMGGKEEEEEE